MNTYKTALKDWKKTSDEGYRIIFDKYKTSNEVKIENIKRRWLVSTGYVPHKPLFNTKTEALKFAKSYMRKY